MRVQLTRRQSNANESTADAMTVRIGTNPIAWSNDDLPELGGETPLELCLSEARQAGYEGIELGNKFPRTPDRLAPVLAKHGLALISGWYGATLLERDATMEIDAMADHLHLLEAFDCSVMVFAETSNAVHGDRHCPISRRPALDDGEWDDFGSRLTAVGDHLRRHGMALAYHHHMGTVVETAEDIHRLMTVTEDSVGLLLDTGHAVLAGADPIRLVKAFGNRIVHVHCKDVRADVARRVRADDMSFLDAVIEGVFTVPGDGAVPFEPILAALAVADYAGWLVVEAEQDPAMADPLSSARLGYANLSRLAASADLGLNANRQCQSKSV